MRQLKIIRHFKKISWNSNSVQKKIRLFKSLVYGIEIRWTHTNIKTTFKMVLVQARCYSIIYELKATAYVRSDVTYFLQSSFGVLLLSRFSIFKSGVFYHHNHFPFHNFATFYLIFASREEENSHSFFCVFILLLSLSLLCSATLSHIKMVEMLKCGRK